MFDVQPLTLTGRVVRLEPLAEAHVPGLTAVGLHETIWNYMVYEPVVDEAGMRRWVRDVLERQTHGTDLPFAVVHLADQRVIGATRFLDIRREHRGVEIGGTWYAPAYQRTAVNTECKYLLLRHAFEVWRCVRVQLKTDLRNERSQRAIERLGALREGVLRNHLLLPDGYMRSSVMYSVIDSEWPAVKTRLEAWLRER